MGRSAAAAATRKFRGDHSAAAAATRKFRGGRGAADAEIPRRSRRRGKNIHPGARPVPEPVADAPRAVVEVHGVARVLARVRRAAAVERRRHVGHERRGNVPEPVAVRFDERRRLRVETGRGTAAAGTRIFRGDDDATAAMRTFSWRRSRGDAAVADIPWRRVAAPRRR